MLARCFPCLRGLYRFRPRWRRGIGCGVGRYAVGGCRRGLASRSSVPFYPSRPCGSFDFLVSVECGRCAPFLSAHFLAMFRGGGVYRFSSRLVPRLVLPVSWDVSWLFFAVCVSFRLVCRFAGVLLSSSFSFRSGVLFVGSWGVSSGDPVFRLVRRSSVFRFARFIVCSFRPLVSLNSPYSLVLSGGSFWRLVGRLVFSVSRFILSVLVSFRPLRLMAMGTGGGSFFSSRGGVLSSPLSLVVESDLAMAAAE